jgi:CHAT domain-containing protein
MKNTPQMPTLPYVEWEIQLLQQLLPTAIPSIRLNQPRRIDILDALAECNIFHFAGHGVSDLFDPSKSHLVVDDSSVTVEDLIDRNLHRNPPLLAYLSACSTGNSQVDGLIDEGIHLMGACQLAGFQHVIGSLWSVSDSHCAEVAKKVYTTMLEGALSHRSVSLGLHNAARALRGGVVETVAGDRGAKLVRSMEGEISPLQDPYYWSAYIHMGI